MKHVFKPADTWSDRYVCCLCGAVTSGYRIFVGIHKNDLSCKGAYA